MGKGHNKVIQRRKNTIDQKAHKETQILMGHWRNARGYSTERLVLLLTKTKKTVLPSFGSVLGRESFLPYFCWACKQGPF